MTALADTWKHRLGDVLLVFGAGYLGLAAVGGPLFFPHDLVAAAAALGLGAWIGDYRTRWWPTARHTDREHELNVPPGHRAAKPGRSALGVLVADSREGVKLKKVLNVGGNSKAIPLPPQYAEFEHLLLDIDPKGSPDIVCDARKLTTLGTGQFDAVYCSHNLEHYYRHDVRRVLAGFLHVLKDGGFADIRVPDIHDVMRTTIERGLDIEDVLYQSPAGPITVLDVLYGYGVEIERSGQDFFAHKTGFTEKSLLVALRSAGFSKTYSILGNLEIRALAFKGMPDQATRALFGLPHDE